MRGLFLADGTPGGPKDKNRGFAFEVLRADAAAASGQSPAGDLLIKIVEPYSFLFLVKNSQISSFKLIS